MEKLLEVNDLCKSYGGKNVLNGLSFNVDRGKVLGILAPNGEGKTTLLDIIAGLIKKNSGNIMINGVALGTETKNMVSYLQDKNVLYKWMKIKDSVSFYKDFFHDFNENKFNRLLESMKLDKNMRVKDLSKGMSEKLGLALTLSRETGLYILDEPISGVDPVAREKIVDTIIENINEESSMIITTHYVGELEKLFDEVLFIGDGHVVEMGEADALREKYAMSLDEIYRKLFGGE